MHLFGDVVFEFLEGLCNVPIGAGAYSLFGVVPFEVHTDVLFGFPINFERVFGTETGDEMINILSVCVFDTEVVDHESEGNVPCLTEKETFGVWCPVVAEFLLVCNKIVICNFARLFEAVPRLFDLCIDIFVTDEFL